MRLLRNISSLAFCLLLSGFFIGIASAANPEQISENTVILDMVVASIDGEALTTSELKDFIGSRGGKIPDNLHSGGLEVRRYLRELVLERLLAKEAEDIGFNVGEESVDAYVDEIKRQNNVDDRGFEAVLGARGLTIEKYREQVVGEIIRARVVNSRVRSKVSVPDEVIARYLEEHPELVPAKGSVRVYLVELPRADASVSELEDIKKKIEAGAAWTEAGGKYFTDLGHVIIADLKQEFQTALKNIDTGQVSEVVKTETSLAILGSQGVAAGEIQLDATLKEQVRSELFNSRFENALQKFLNDDLPKKYHVEIKL